MKYVEESKIGHWRKYYLHYSVATLVVVFVVVFAVLIPWVKKNCQVAAEDGAQVVEVTPPPSELTIGDDTIFPEETVHSILSRLTQGAISPLVNTKNENDVVLDKINHLLFIAETNNNRVLVYKLDSKNIETGPFPNVVLGQSSLSSRNSSASQSGLNAPRFLVHDPAGHRLFVSDSGNNRVLIFDTANLTINQSASHVLGQKDFISSLASFMPDGLNNPGGLDFDKQTNQLSVRDEGNDRQMIFNVSNITDGQPATEILPIQSGSLTAPSSRAE